MADFPVTLFPPSQCYEQGDLAIQWDWFSARILAQGDSWFSIGAYPPGLTSNIVNELRLSKSVALVNCARPGKVLAHMTDKVTEPIFRKLLSGKFSLKWDVLLFSGGGNDLIDAAAVGPAAGRQSRLFLKADERPAQPHTASDYLCEEGWQTFKTHLTEVFQILMDLKAAGENKNTPMLFHNYADITPRPAGAGFSTGPWLQPSLDAFGIPQDQWAACANELMGKLNRLMADLVAAEVAARPGGVVRVIDTQSAGLIPAAPNTAGESNDWINEIHPTRGGYRKLAAKVRGEIDPLLP